MAGYGQAFGNTVYGRGPGMGIDPQVYGAMPSPFGRTQPGRPGGGFDPISPAGVGGLTGGGGRGGGPGGGGWTDRLGSWIGSNQELLAGGLAGFGEYWSQRQDREEQKRQFDEMMAERDRTRTSMGRSLGQVWGG